jgi:hypothetical protein
VVRLKYGQVHPAGSRVEFVAQKPERITHTETKQGAKIMGIAILVPCSFISKS